MSGAPKFKLLEPEVCPIYMPMKARICGQKPRIGKKTCSAHRALEEKIEEHNKEAQVKAGLKKDLPPGIFDTVIDAAFQIRVPRSEVYNQERELRAAMANIQQNEVDYRTLVEEEKKQP